MVMNGAQDGANKLTDFNNLVKRGLAKPSEYKMFQHNQKTGFDLLKKNAASFDKTFTEYSERTTGNLNAPQEIWMAKQLEGFANINNLQVQTDPETGNVVQLRVDENGEPITGESMSVQHMTLLMKQRVDKFDVNVATETIKASLGDIITADIKTRNPGVTDVEIETMRSRAETEFFATEGGQDVLNKKAQQLIDNPQQRASMLVTNVPGPNGETNFYKIGSQEDFDAHTGDDASNPIVVMEFGEDNLYSPKFTEAQEKAALKYAKENITAGLSVKETQTVKKTQATEYQDTQATINKGEKDKEIQTLGKNLNLFVTGTGADADAAGNYITKQYNNNLKEGDPQMNSFKRNDREATQADVDAGYATTVGEDIAGTYTVEIDGKVIKPISAYDANGKKLTPEQALRTLWQEADLKGDVDSFLDGGGEVGDDLGVGDGGGEGRKDKIVYSGASDVVYIDAKNKVSIDKFFNSASGGDLGATLNNADLFSDDGRKEIQVAFTNLINSPAFVPKALKKIISDEGLPFEVVVDKYSIGSGKDDNGMIVRIGNQTITFNDVYDDAKTGGTAGITQKIRKAIEQEVRKVNKGGSNKEKPSFEVWKQSNPNGTFADYNAS